MTGNNYKKRPLELYLHIPFCVRKCHYCDFLSGPADASLQEQYMKALLAELSGRSGECREYQVQTVFVGGGTPSVVDAVWMDRIVEEIKRSYDLAEDAEITIEINPGTVDRDKLEIYKRAGINRLSIGLQSAVDEELRRLGRIHTPEQFLRTYQEAAGAGFTNINVDVMSALPGQTPESYRRTLDMLMGLCPRPAHISAYSLIIEEGTPFHDLWEQGKLELPDEDNDRLMYALTGEVLGANGYHRYEISNYALDGYECRHNCGYWQRKEYLGFGIGAASLMKEWRFRNGQDIRKYVDSPLFQREELKQLSLEERMEEFLFLGLRMTKGVSCEAFLKAFGQRITDVYGEVIQRNMRDGLLAFKEGSYHLTDRGMDVSNYVMAQFLLG
ncbi:MAG: oxygen-independent coproporphyrinogen III oxidase [Lachnospiraceae bacterium]|nr:oxygen-independent coproporphyrinogen III oxidase [Lachnospiraceae bacterium]